MLHLKTRKTSKNMQESRVTLVDNGSMESQTQKLIQQKDKRIKALESKVEKLNTRLKKKEDKTMQLQAKKAAKADKKNPQLPIWDCELNTTAMVIAQLALQVYKKFPHGAKEHHFQALLEAELQRKGFVVQQEVAITYNVTTISGEILQLPHDIRGREDLLLPQEQMILELKQTKCLGDSEHQQLMRYMHQRQSFSEWGDDTKGMLINFGDEDLEIWFVQYSDDSVGATEHIRMMKVPRQIHKSWEANAFTIVS